MKILDRILRRKLRPMDNVTPRVQRLLIFARREADRLAQGSVGSEHLLLGLLDLEEGVGFLTLKNLGADPAAIRRSIEAELQQGQQLHVEPKIPAREDFLQTFRRAGVEAEGMKQTYLGTEHILLALFRLSDGIVFRALRSVGTDGDAVREMITKTLAASSEGPDNVSGCAKGYSASQQ